MYLNLIQVAESFGVSEQIVEGWVRTEGLPVTNDRGRWMFDRVQVVRWATSRGLAGQAGFLAPQTPAFTTGARLETLARRGGIRRDVAPEHVLDEFERALTTLADVTPDVLEYTCARMRRRGGLTWAPVGRGFALPHASQRIALGRDSGALSVLFLREPWPLSEALADVQPITSLLFFVSPSPRAHLDVLGRLSRLLAREDLRGFLRPESSDERILEAFASADALRPGVSEPEETE